MKITLALCLFSIFSIGVWAQPDESFKSSEAKLLEEAKAFESKLVADLRMGDRATLEKMVDAGFVFIHSTGLLETRDQYLSNAAGGNLALQGRDFQRFDETWRVFEPNTVVRYSRTILRNPATNAENRLRNINVYIKTKDKGWQWVSGQSTKLPVRPKAFALDAKVLDESVGVYRIGGERTFTVTKENSALYGLTTGRRKVELVPSSETTFVLFDEENDPGFMETIFERGADGKITQVVLRLNGQQVWKAVKIK